MIFAIINCFMVPIEIAVDVDFVKTFWYETLNLAIDAFFILDLLVNFNTSFE